jgi:uncharacterized protein (DUF983 family)
MPTKALLPAILEAKCPRCRQGNIYTYPLINFPKFAKTNKHCPVCKLQFEREPGFFFGAMYISYGFSVAIVLVTAFIAFYLLEDPSLLFLAVLIPSVSILALPFSFRYSRVLYLYAFGGVRYEPAFAKKNDNL